jgi:hypothetical protein
MIRTSSLSLAASICAAVFALVTFPVMADEPLVKLAPTPAPSAGPTLAAAEEFCGDPAGKAEALIDLYSKKPGLKEVYKSTDYVAYSDDDKNASVMYTFTTKNHPAYPAAVCRKPVQEGSNLVIKMSVVCDGNEEACAKLRNDFNVMTAKMQAEVDQKLAQEKK